MTTFIVIWLTGVYPSFVSWFNHIQNNSPAFAKKNYRRDLVDATILAIGMSWIGVLDDYMAGRGFFKYGFLPKKGFKEGGKE